MKFKDFLVEQQQKDLYDKLQNLGINFYEADDRKLVVLQLSLKALDAKLRQANIRVGTYYDRDRSCVYCKTK